MLFPIVLIVTENNRHSDINSIFKFVWQLQNITLKKFVLSLNCFSQPWNHSLHFFILLILLMATFPQALSVCFLTLQRYFLDLDLLNFDRSQVRGSSTNLGRSYFRGSLSLFAVLEGFEKVWPDFVKFPWLLQCHVGCLNVLGKRQFLGGLL